MGVLGPECVCEHPEALHFEEYRGRCGGGVMVDIGSGELVEKRCECRRFRAAEALAAQPPKAP